MSAFELILAIKDYCNGDCKETCEIVTDLIEQSLGSHFSHDLTLALEEFIDCNCLCPICFSPMESKASYTESRGEYIRKRERKYGKCIYKKRFKDRNDY